MSLIIGCILCFSPSGRDFAATRSPGANSGSASEVLSINSILSASHSSILARRARLSPAIDARTRPEKSPSAAKSINKSTDHGFEMLTPAPKPDHTQKKVDTRTRDPNSPSEILFPRRPVPPLRPLQSSLTAMLASSGANANPFSELYGAISGRAETASMNLTVFFPHAHVPSGKPMVLNVRKDATVEEVIGHSLWSYWEEGWLPRLDEGLSGEDDLKWAATLSAVGWIMRIAEEDGEVDDEFPRKLLIV